MACSLLLHQSKEHILQTFLRGRELTMKKQTEVKTTRRRKSLVRSGLLACICLIGGIVGCGSEAQTASNGSGGSDVDNAVSLRRVEELTFCIEHAAKHDLSIPQMREADKWDDVDCAELGYMIESKVNIHTKDTWFPGDDNTIATIYRFDPKHHISVHGEMPAQLDELMAQGVYPDAFTIIVVRPRNADNWAAHKLNDLRATWKKTGNVTAAAAFDSYNHAIDRIAEVADGGIAYQEVESGVTCSDGTTADGGFCQEEVVISSADVLHGIVTPDTFSASCNGISAEDLHNDRGLQFGEERWDVFIAASGSAGE